MLHLSVLMGYLLLETAQVLLAKEKCTIKIGVSSNLPTQSHSWEEFNATLLGGSTETFLGVFSVVLMLLATFPKAEY